MILDQNQQSDVQLIGDIQQNKVGIDKDNINFITQLLTVNLYSKPLQSFVRETVANGWDSQVEAGTTDKPLIIRLYSSDKDTVVIAIRDYGTGLSPERFKETYCNIGSSTKRESNDYIGMFGIGRMSALAVSNTVLLTNYYNNVCTKYIMYQDNGNISIDKLLEQPTEEDNGLEVCVDTEIPITQAEFRGDLNEAIRALSYYDNVYINDEIGNSRYNGFNNRRVEECNTFKCCDSMATPGIIVGNVFYSVDYDYFESFGGDELFSPQFAIKIPIGEVDVTPNREALLYNNKTKAALTKRFKEAYYEIHKIIYEQYNKAFDNIMEYDNVTMASFIPITTPNKDLLIVNLKTRYLDKYIPLDKIKIKDFQVTDNFRNLWAELRDVIIDKDLTLYEYSNSQFVTKWKSNQSLCKLITKCYEGVVLFTNEPLKPIAKQYFRSKTTATTLFIDRRKLKRCLYIYRRYIEDIEEIKLGFRDPNLRFIYKELITALKQCKSFNNSDVPQEYLDSCKVKVNRKQSRKVVIHSLTLSAVTNYTTSCKRINRNSDKYSSIEQLSRIHKTVIYSYTGDKDFDTFFQAVATTMPISWFLEFVTIAKSNFPLLEGFKNCINFNSIFEQRNSIASKLVTYIYLDEKYNFSNFNAYVFHGKIDDKILNRLQDHYFIFKNIHTHSYGSNNIFDTDLIKSLCEIYYQNKWLNYGIISDFKELLPYVLLNKIFRSDSYNVPILTYLSEYYLKHNTSKNYSLLKNLLNSLTDEYTQNKQLPHFNIG